MPDIVAARSLASSAFVRLASAIKRKNFVSLYESTAPSFQRGASIQQVADGFRPLTDAGIDLTRADPELLTLTSKPYVDEHGVFTVRGVQPTPQQAWHFEFGFLPQEQGWTLTVMSLSSTGE